ncbi:MAG: TIM barrel protein, partial [Paracoccus sp. (in: a-proteobacteria)]|nr:TIM barrel protein [Paracoccus sp. (in: a-proteobacteria)]
GLQFDAYHAQIITGDAMATFAAHRPLIRHIQIAGLPDRHEPVSGGGLDYPAFFAAVDASDYRGWVSAEYSPRTVTVAGLNWLKQTASA